MMVLMAARLICSGRCCKIPALRRPGRPGLGGHRVAAKAAALIKGRKIITRAVAQDRPRDRRLPSENYWWDMYLPIALTLRHHPPPRWQRQVGGGGVLWTG